MNETKNFKLPEQKSDFLVNNIPKGLMIVDIIMILAYFFLITFKFPHGNTTLFTLLILGEAFHLWQALSYIYTIWDTTYVAEFDSNFQPPVDVFITVAGEPKDIVELTVKSALEMEYPDFKVYILNDGLVAGKENWQEMEDLAKEYNIQCLTRRKPGGAKAGNINHALTKSNSPYVVIFDADHIPHADFLKKTLGYFTDPKVAFVQSPQYYKNDTNFVANTAWEQQKLFFGAICKGKNRSNSTFMCGTNMVIKRQPLMEVGGMCETNIAEDFLTSLFIHEKKWKSVYVPEILAEGLAPEDFLSYYKQQYRWTRGSLELIFKYNPLFNKNLTIAQKIQYLASASYYLSGVIVFINMIFPLIYYFTGQVPLSTSTMLLASVFLPYIFLNLYILQLSSNFTYKFQALAFSVSSFDIHLKALWSLLTGQKAEFSVTSKTQITGNFPHLVIPHLSYILITIIGFVTAYIREGWSTSLAANTAWALLYVVVFIPFIKAAIPDLNLNKLLTYGNKKLGFKQAQATAK